MQNEIQEIDGFIFAIIDESEVKDSFSNNEHDYYILHNDGTKSSIEDENHINEAILNGNKFGAAIGLKSTLVEEFEEGEQNRFRNNDFRSFEEWLNDKINVILE